VFGVIAGKLANKIPVSRNNELSKIRVVKELITGISNNIIIKYSTFLKLYLLPTVTKYENIIKYSKTFKKVFKGLDE
jgi:hypothetical protein